MECMNSYSQEGEEEEERKTWILYAQCKKCFENLPTWFEALCKSIMALSSLCYLSVAKNDPKKDMRKTTREMVRIQQL
jgi:hypothetical protein